MSDQNEKKIEERKNEYNAMWRGNEERVIREFLDSWNKDDKQVHNLYNYIEIHLDNKYNNVR